MGTKYTQFTIEERCEIARLHADGQSARRIAADLGRAPSSISREIKRNTGKQIGYKPAYADDQAWARRWRGSRISRCPELANIVLSRLEQGWSPEQVSGRLRLEKSPHLISPESIYRFIYAQIARTKNYAWRFYLPRQKSKRRTKRPSKSAGIHQIKHRVSIHKRPVYIEKRCQPGHWETDLMMLSDKKQNILVAQERTSRFTFMAKQSGKHTEPTIAQVQNWLVPLPEPLRRSVTQDNGPEFFAHYRLNALGIKTYFCDSHSPWQKGGVENMNGRIRHYIPLKINPNSFENADVQLLAARLNATPRKCLGFYTPAEVFSKHLQLLHFKCESTSPLARE